MPPGWHPRRRRSHQPARIDGIEGDVGADGCVDGGLKLRLIVHAGFLDAARNVDQRLLFRIARETAGGIFERGQLAIGIEDVELGLVGDERPADILRSAPVSASVANSLGFADVECNAESKSTDRDRR